jgi:hypothetical protein
MPPKKRRYNPQRGEAGIDWDTFGKGPVYEEITLIAKTGERREVWATETKTGWSGYNLNDYQLYRDDSEIRSFLKFWPRGIWEKTSENLG